MYLDFFSFQSSPFEITPDTRFFYLSPRHREIIETLKYGIEHRRGFLLLAGEVGTGKTTSLRALLNLLSQNKNTETALVMNPLLSPRDLLKAIATDLGLGDVPGESIQDYLTALNGFLLRRDFEGKNVVVIIDEAQNLPDESLEMLRLLSNLETETHKLIQILLAGQPELLQKLRRHDFRQLRQRIQIQCILNPFSAEEVAEYVTHRVRVAMPLCCLSFQPAALKRIHKYTSGIPRLINRLCDLALVAAYVDEAHVITPKIVDKAFREMKDKSWRRGLPLLKKWSQSHVPSS